MRRAAQWRQSTRESGAQDGRRTAWIAALGFSAFGLAMMAWAVSQAYTAFNLRDHGVAAQGRIISVQQPKQTECEVEYQDSAGNWYQAWFDDQCVGMQPGQSIPVKYLSSDPSTAAAMGTLTVTYIAINKSGYFFVGLLLAVFGVLGIVAMLILRRRVGTVGRWPLAPWRT